MAVLDPKRKGMTWKDLVKEYFPNATERQVEFILWEKTRFPLVPYQFIEQDLKSYQMQCFAWRKNNFVEEGEY